jgi:hypothetical protein
VTSQPISRRLRLVRHQLRVGYEAFRIRQSVVPGHFYSTIPSIQEVSLRHAAIFPDPAPDELLGINLRVPQQLALMEKLAAFYEEQPFGDGPRPNLRFYFDNKVFSYGDALVLYGMLRHFKPQRIVEVGSGFSSAVMLDTNELFLDRTLQCTFIEPHPERLQLLLRPDDVKRCTVIRAPVQDVDRSIFDQLEPGDILFIDSSHTLKVGSDVSRIFSTIIPSVPVGTLVHIHDIFYPFEYPPTWIYQGRFHNEDYMLHAFLQFNDAFEIMLFNSYLGQKHADAVTSHMPLWGKKPGASIWLRRIA